MLVHAFEGADINHESSRKAFETPVLTTLPPYHYELDINHESSRKAFETGWVSCLDDRDGLPISITNLAERHLRLLWSLEPPPRQCRISITNLAERHLRLFDLVVLTERFEVGYQSRI